MFRTGYRAIVALLGWLALATDYALIVMTRSGPALFTWTINFFSFFSILCNILVALAMTLPWVAPRSRLGRWFDRPWVRTILAAYIIIVCIVFYVMLRNLAHPHGLRFAYDFILHYVTPILFIIDWLLFVPKQDLSWRIPLGGFLLPVLYIIWTFLHGAVAGFYPYPFLNVSQLGYEQVLANIAGLIMLGVGVLLVLIGIGRLMNAVWPMPPHSSVSDSRKGRQLD